MLAKIGTLIALFKNYQYFNVCMMFAWLLPSSNIIPLLRQTSMIIYGLLLTRRTAYVCLGAKSRIYPLLGKANIKLIN